MKKLNRRVNKNQQCREELDISLSKNVQEEISVYLHLKAETNIFTLGLYLSNSQEI